MTHTQHLICVGLLSAPLMAGIAVAAPTETAYPGPERLNVLYVCAPHNLQGGSAASKTLIESMSGLRLAAVPVPFDGGDHVLDVDGLMGRDPRMIAVRKATLLTELNKRWDAIFFVPGRTVGNVDADIQKAMADAVGRGVTLMWFAGKLEQGKRAYSAVEPSLAALLPYQELGEIAPYEGINPIAGMGLEQAGLAFGRTALPAGNGFAVLHALPYRKATLPFIVYRRFGKAAVVGIQTGGVLFPKLANETVDGERLWATALERLVRFALAGHVAPAVRVVVAREPNEKNVARLVLTGPAKTKVRLDQDDQRGHVWTLTDSLTLTGGTTQVDVTLRPSPYPQQAVRAVPLSDSAVPGTTFVKLPTALQLGVTVLQQATAPTYKTRNRSRGSKSEIA